MFKIELTGIYKNEELCRKISNLVKLLENENGSYDIKFSIEEMESVKSDKLESARIGYAVLKSETEGLHSPASEFDERKYTGKYEKNGRTHYQTFYICECGHDGKHYLTNGTVFCTCKSCGK